MRGWQIVKKDLKLLMRDRRALATLVALPLIFITVIGLTTGQLLGWADKNKTISIAFFADESNANKLADELAEMQLPESQTKLIRARNKQLTRTLFNSLQKIRGFEIQTAESEKAAQAMYQDGTVDAALIVGPEFIERVAALKTGDIVAPEDGKLADGLATLDIRLESKNQGSTTHAIIEQVVYMATFANVAYLPMCSNPLGVVRGQVRVPCEEFEALADAPPIPLDPPKVQMDKSNAVYQELVPGMTVMFVFFLVNIMAQSFIQERELGTLRRLRIAPLGTTSLLTGKTIPFFIISITQTVLLFVCGRFLFHMYWGEQPWLLLPVIFTTSIAATSLGLMVATLVRTESQVSAYANLVVVGLAGISGCFMPRDWLPDLMKKISLYTPHAWALMAYDQLLHEGQPNLMLVLESCAMLTGFGILFFCIGCLRFSKIE